MDGYQEKIDKLETWLSLLVIVAIIACLIFWSIAWEAGWEHGQRVSKAYYEATGNISPKLLGYEYYHADTKYLVLDQLGEAKSKKK